MKLFPRRTITDTQALCETYLWVGVITERWERVAGHYLGTDSTAET